MTVIYQYTKTNFDHGKFISELKENFSIENIGITYTNPNLTITFESVLSEENISLLQSIVDNHIGIVSLRLPSSIKHVRTTRDSLSLIISIEEFANKVGEEYTELVFKTEYTYENNVLLSKIKYQYYIDNSRTKIYTQLYEYSEDNGNTIEVISLS